MKYFYAGLLLVACMLFPRLAKAQSITLCDGTQTSNSVPVYAYWMDHASHFQMIYPAEMLTQLKGQALTGLTFYLASVPNKAWTNDAVKISLATVEETSFSSAEYITPSQLATVATVAVDMAVTETEWNISFENPYIYNGGNLLVDIQNDKAGSSPRISWYGQSQNSATALTKSSSVSKVQFLPKMTVSYSESSELGAKASVSAQELVFPMTFADSPATQSIYVSNVGSEILDVNISLAGSSAFTLEKAQFIGLDSGESIPVTVTFSPSFTGEDNATMTIDCGEGGTFEIAVKGSGLVAPTGFRKTFDDQMSYASELPEGWTAYGEEYVITSGVLEDATANYELFPETMRFSNFSLDGSKGIAWDHVNWAQEGEYYKRYYYLVSPELNGTVMLRAAATYSAAQICFVEAYPVEAYDELNKRYTIAKEPIEIDWDSPLSSKTWNVGTFNLDEPAQIAFFIKLAAINFVASDKVTSGIATLPALDTAEATAAYDLAGRKVSVEAVREGRVPAGVYILRNAQGKASKLLVR